MKTGSRIMADAKVRLVRDVVKKLRMRDSKKGLEAAWGFIEMNKEFWEELKSYDLVARERVSALNKIAFPDRNREEVDAALTAGNNYSDIYALARGRAFIDKDAKNKYKRNKNGAYLIVKNLI